ncbi:MAG TPA: SRPBCC domain-containing protein [Polyangiaceae bacterium]
MTYSTSASIVIQAPREAIWRAVTEPALVKRWFFGTDLVTDWKVGSPLFFRGEWEGKTYEDRGTVLSFDPPNGFSFNYWSSMSGDPDEPERRQIVRYELTGEGSGVRVTIHQSNTDTQERAEHSKKNWENVLAGLKKFVEEAKA